MLSNNIYIEIYISNFKKDIIRDVDMEYDEKDKQWKHNGQPWDTEKCPALYFIGNKRAKAGQTISTDI